MLDSQGAGVSVKSYCLEENHQSISEYFNTIFPRKQKSSQVDPQREKIVTILKMKIAKKQSNWNVWDDLYYNLKGSYGLEEEDIERVFKEYELDEHDIHTREIWRKVPYELPKKMPVGPLKG